MINLILIGIIVVLLLHILYKWGTKNHDLFEKQGLKYEKPLPFLGNAWYMFNGTGMPDRLLYAYNLFPNEKLFGVNELGQITYFIRSPEIVKQFTIKDFGHFQDHVPFVDSSSDELFGNVLFTMKGKQWRDMRTSLSPLFTGSKMRTMLQLINNCTTQVITYIHEEYQKHGVKSYRMKDFFSRYTNDVIATCAFGVECDSFRQPNNEIYKIGQCLLKFSRPTTIFKFLIVGFMPLFAKVFNIKIFDEETKNMFFKLIINTMDVRQKEGIIRPDLLQLLMKLKDGKLLKEKEKEQDSADDGTNIGEVKTTWSDIEIIAQSFQFYFAGFDTSSTAMSYIAYELAVNPDIQTKLIDEIDEIYDSLDGNPITYDNLYEMKYMDMVISEVLRKWPPLVVLDRQCVKKYTYKDEDGLKFTIDEGSAISIPVYAFHMDPKYFPNPEKFDPERFSDENKANINFNAYLPFGLGPRGCIGIRFALMEIKAFLFYFLRNFRFALGKETQVPLKLKKSLFGLIPEKEITLNLRLRMNKSFV